MGALFSKLWNDPDYFQKSLAALVAALAVLLPTLPLGELGAVGYWLGKLAVPVAVWLAATGKSSGLTTDEAVALRALIPPQD